MIDERTNKPLELLWNIVSLKMHFNKLLNDRINPKIRYNYPFPNHPPNIKSDLFIKIAKEEINECQLFQDKRCSKCKCPEVICIVEDLNNFMRYKQLKECMKKYSSK